MENLSAIIEAILFVSGDPVRVDALAHAMKLAPTMDKDAIILVNLSGRGDKDVAQVADLVNSGAFVPAGD